MLFSIKKSNLENLLWKQLIPLLQSQKLPIFLKCSVLHRFQFKTGRFSLDWLTSQSGFFQPVFSWKTWITCNYFIPLTYSKLYQTTRRNILWKALTIFKKSFILDVWKGSEYVSVFNSMIEKEKIQFFNKLYLISNCVAWNELTQRDKSGDGSWQISCKKKKVSNNSRGFSGIPDPLIGNFFFCWSTFHYILTQALHLINSTLS